MVAIQQIETQYAGYRFRSRLEARWAVFFDALGIRWEYEPQGYVVDGRPYLPDFKLTLPTDEIAFAEVKNSETDEFEGDHVRLCRSLARQSMTPVLLLVGPPGHRMYHQFTPNLGANHLTAVFFQDYDRMIVTADRWWFERATLNERTGAMEFAFDERGLVKSFGRGLVAAVIASRSARFEHGERGR